MGFQLTVWNFYFLFTFFLSSHCLTTRKILLNCCKMVLKKNIYLPTEVIINSVQLLRYQYLGYLFYTYLMPYSFKFSMKEKRMIVMFCLLSYLFAETFSLRRALFHFIFCLDAALPCDSFPCQNAGACVNDGSVTGFRCICEPQFFGIFCELQGRFILIYNYNILNQEKMFHT